MTQNTKCGLTKSKEYKMSRANLKTVDIKGNPYVTVNERLKAFWEDYPEWSLKDEILTPLEEIANHICIKAYIVDEKGVTRATGLAHEINGVGPVNKTSHVENCETSAWGRALGCFGYGIDTSVASADEVHVAIKQQEYKPTNQEAKFKKAKTFYIRLFSQLGWTKKDSPDKATFTRLCGKAKVDTFIMAWAMEDTEKMRKMLGDAGVKINATTVINEALCNSIQHNVTQYVSFKPNTLL